MEAAAAVALWMLAVHAVQTAPLQELCLLCAPAPPAHPTWSKNRTVILVWKTSGEFSVL